MRIRAVRRILLLGLALALLCALPAVTPSLSDARPNSWVPNPADPDSGPDSNGDGDGTVVKARYIGGTTDAASGTTTVTRQRTWNVWRTYLSLVRWGIGLRWSGF